MVKKGTVMTDPRRLPRAIAEQWAWQLEASCRGMDVGVFYHPAAERNKARKQRIAQAKAICQQCPVIAECLDHALRVREPYGIWGGRSEDDAPPCWASIRCDTPLGS
jgi:WhiB family redox-sensing transcriptional regulator